MDNKTGTKRGKSGGLPNCQPAALNEKQRILAGLLIMSTAHACMYVFNDREWTASPKRPDEKYIILIIIMFNAKLGHDGHQC